MNKRIQELLDQCQTPLLDAFGDIKCMETNYAKFAVLIIKECTDVIENAVNHREPASTYTQKIQQHFGAE